MFAAARLALARVPRWPRLLAALTCLLLAGLSLANAHARRAPTAAGVPVVVAARPLGTGHVLMARDLQVEMWPAAARASWAAAQRSTLLGRRLAGPVAAGEPVTAGRLVGSSLTAGLPPGIAAVPVQIAQRSAAEFVHPGDRIDLVAAPPDTTAGVNVAAAAAVPDTVASGVRVLAVLPPADTGTVVVVATDQLTARRLARVGTTAPFLPVGESP